MIKKGDAQNKYDEWNFRIILNKPFYVIFLYIELKSIKIKNISEYYIKRLLTIYVF